MCIRDSLGVEEDGPIGYRPLLLHGAHPLAEPLILGLLFGLRLPALRLFLEMCIRDRVVSCQGDEILSVTMPDHSRIGKEALLAAVVAVFLIRFAGRTGGRAIVSFVLTVLMLWYPPGRAWWYWGLRGCSPAWCWAGR